LQHQSCFIGDQPICHWPTPALQLKASRVAGAGAGARASSVGRFAGRVQAFPWMQMEIGTSCVGAAVVVVVETVVLVAVEVAQPCPPKLQHHSRFSTVQSAAETPATTRQS